MAKRKVELETPPEPQQELKKPGGRTIGFWRKDTLNYLGKGASDNEVTERIIAIAKENGYDYQTNDEETAEWRPRLQAEMDGTAPATPRSRGKTQVSSDPTLGDLMAVMTEIKDAALPELNGLSAFEAWNTLIDRVEGLAAKVGGLANLRKCLSAAASLTALTKGD